MNGILNVLKPPGMTSFDVVAWLRRVTKVKKIGHTGTLDPMACGVLPVCIGHATRAIEYLTDKDKLYRAELTLGTVTDTQDSYGVVMARKEPDATDEEIRGVFRRFEGKQLQLPPMYSAIKVEGKKLYELARQGVSIERTPREVEIFSIEILNVDRSEGIKILFDVHCSKGTYIRTLCHDIGEGLGCGGHMSFLLRKRSGAFDLMNALTIEETERLAGEGRLQDRLLGVDSAFDRLKGIVLDEGRAFKLLNGLSVKVAIEPEDTGNEEEGLVRVYKESGAFFALGELKRDGEAFFVKSRKLFL